MSIETYKEIAPAAWASYIVNGDVDDLSDQEIAACDRWRDRMAKTGPSLEFLAITIDTNEEPYFGRWDHDWGQDGVTGGDLINYTVVYRLTE